MGTLEAKVTGMSFRVQNTSFNYGRVEALKGVSFEFPIASRIALVGANGAGKSTLMALISGALKTSSGLIQFQNKKQENFASGRTLVSHLPQDAYFPAGVSINRSLIHFCRLKGLSSGEAQRKVDELLELVGLSDAKQRNDRELSHGMRKRAALAQALIPQAPLLILDEPTAGLDPVNAHQIREIIRNLGAETTLLISSHNLSELEDLCDQLVILDQGETKFCGTMRDATQAQHELRIRLSHINDDTHRKLEQLGLKVHYRDLELRLEPSKRNDDPDAQIRAGLISILESGINIESIHQGTSLEMSLIETLKNH